MTTKVRKVFGITFNLFKLVEYEILRRFTTFSAKHKLKTRLLRNDSSKCDECNVVYFDN